MLESLLPAHFPFTHRPLLNPSHLQPWSLHPCTYFSHQEIREIGLASLPARKNTSSLGWEGKWGLGWLCRTLFDRGKAVATPTVISFVTSHNGGLSTQFPPPQNNLNFRGHAEPLTPPWWFSHPSDPNSVVTHCQLCDKHVTYLSTVLLTIRQVASIITILQELRFSPMLNDLPKVHTAKKQQALIQAPIPSCC